MNINATIIGQFITFTLLIWFTMKWVWPPIIKTLEERKNIIASGIAAAEKSQRDLAEAEQKITALIQNSKQEAAQILERAAMQAALLLEEARAEATQEKKRIVETAKTEIQQELTLTKEALKKQVAALAVAGAEQIIQQNLSSVIQKSLLDQLYGEIK